MKISLGIIGVVIVVCGGIFVYHSLYHKDKPVDLTTPDTPTLPATPASLITDEPIITDVEVTSFSETSMAIKWTTDRPASSHIQYGESTSYHYNLPYRTASS